jgi:ABC-type phosphate transport system substrate-binding protein
MTSAIVLVSLLVASVAGWQAAPPDAKRDQPGSEDLAIILHRSNPVEDLTVQRLRRIFLFETETWSHGRKITVVMREKGQPERGAAIRLICGISEADFDRHVLLQTFKGDARFGPRSIRSTPAMLRFVFNAQGAIGHVFASEVDASVKVVRIDGLLPGDPKYPLRQIRGRPKGPKQ